MPAVMVVFIVVTVLVVAAIGLVAVGGVTARLAAAPPRNLFDLDEAVGFVADRLPPHASGQVTYDELRRLLGWHLDYLEARGVAVENDGSEPAPARGSDPAVVAEDDEGVAYLIGRAEQDGIEVDDMAVVEVLEAEAAYLAAIGALGPPVGEDL
jgi:hypothetical protein